MSTIAPETTVHPAAPAAPYATAPQAVENRSLSITSLVLGVVSIAAGWTIVAPIAGLVLGILGLRREPAGRSFALWGIVLNSIMLAGTVIVGLVAVVFGLALLPFAFVGN